MGAGRDAPRAARRRRPTTAPTRSSSRSPTAGAAGTADDAAGDQRRHARALRAEPELPGRASRPPGSSTTPATRPRPTRRRRPCSAAHRSRPARRSSTAASRPCRATRATSTTTSRARPSSSTSTTGSTSRRPPAACVPIENVTTCRTTPATWAEYVTSENRVMFRHVVDNDPRPHYIHQSNLADYNPALPETAPGPGRHRLPGVRRPPGPLRGELRPRQAPLVQLTHTQIGQTLAQQSAWAANRTRHGLAAGRPRARQEHGRGRGRGAAHRHRPRARSTAASSRAGSRSRPAPSRCSTPDDPANTAAPDARPARARVGETLTAVQGHAGPARRRSPYDYRWQRCDDDGHALHERSPARRPPGTRSTAADEGATRARRRARRQLDLLGQPGRRPPSTGVVARRRGPRRRQRAAAGATIVEPRSRHAGDGPGDVQARGPRRG